MNTAIQTLSLRNRHSLSLTHNYQAKSGEILLYDEIGYWGVTAQQFIADLQANDADALTIRVNSPGGDVFDGFAIHNAIKADPRPITVVVDGLAASAASYIAIAGDEVRMAENAFMMIHNAWAMVIGNANDLLDMAETMQKFDNQLAGMYDRKAGGGRKKWRDLMDAESWFNADEAKELGLIDAVIGEEEPAAMAFDVSQFHNTPTELKRRVEAALRDAGASHAAAKRALSEGFAALRLRDEGASGLRDGDQFADLAEKFASAGWMP